MRTHWDDNKKKWILDYYADGKRKQFYSSVPGKKGLKIVNDKYNAWLMNEVTNDMTVDQVAKQYLDDLKARRGVKAPSVLQNEQYIRLYIAPKVGKQKIGKITLRQWQALINTASGVNKPLSKKTLMNLRGVITALVKFGYQNYQCELLRGDLYIPAGHSQKEKKILQPAQIKRLLEPSSLWYYNTFIFLLFTGMRPGEALGLKVDDVSGETIKIKRAVNTHGEITEGKNENAKREIPIGATVRKILDETIQRNKDLNLDTEWVFCDRYGGPGKQSTMRNQWNELKQERSLESTIYELRHTFVSLMKNVLPEQQIKDIVGHSVAMPTFTTYGHLVDGESKKYAATIDDTLRGIAN